MPSIRRLALLQPERTGVGRRLARYIVEAADRAGMCAQVFATSDPLEAFDPDAVLALGPDAPKLTRHPTYGLLTESWIHYQQPRLLRNVLGYDGYLTASEPVRQWVEDVSFGARKCAPLAFFPPSTPATTLGAREGARSLACLGGDGLSDAVARLLEGREYVARTNGLVPAWTDDESEGIHRVLAACGAAVWLGSPAASGDDQPALPLFEIVACGAVAITSRNAFVERWFGDAMLYVDADAPPQVQAWQIDRHMTWIAGHPREADQLAARAHASFSPALTLETALESLCGLHERVLAEKGYVPTSSPPPSGAAPSVVYIVRTHGTPQRVLQSLRLQHYPDLRTVVVPDSPSLDVSAVASEFADLAPTLLEPVAGSGSAALWAGLRAARDSGATLFGVVDDRDELFPNHLHTLVRTLAGVEDKSWFGPFGLAYSGVAERALTEFDGDRLARDADGRGPTRLRIRHFRFYHPGYLDDGAHEVHPGAFLARTSLLDEEVLTDPDLAEGAESYLELLLAEKTLFAFSCEVTALTRDREDDAADRGQVAPMDEARRRTFFRTYGRQFPAAAVYLHNVIFMTAFDKDLLAPILSLPATSQESATVTFALEPMGDAAAFGPFVRVSGRPASGAVLTAGPIAPGRYRLRCYFATGNASALERPPFDVTVAQAGPTDSPGTVTLLSLRRVEHAYLAEYELDVERRHGGTVAGLHVVRGAAGAFELLGVLADRLARVLTRSVLDLPADQPLWLYGAGQGGRQAKRKLELAGLRVCGFIDKFKTGTLEGVPIVDLPTAQANLGANTTVVIASMFWEEIRKDLETAGVTASLYSFYPFTGDVVYALN